MIKKILTIILSILIIVSVFYLTKDVINLDSRPFSQPISGEQTKANNLFDRIVSQVGQIKSQVLGEQTSQKQTNQPAEEIIAETQSLEKKAVVIIEGDPAEADYAPHPSYKIRIIKKPKGQEPDWVNEAWLGLELPVIKKIFAQKGGQEVLTGEYRQEDTYVVPLEDALALLKAKNPDAEKWWRENVPLRDIDGIGFEREVCELIIEE